MTDLILEDVPQAGEKPQTAEFYLGTVITWGSATGVQIQLDGQSEAMTKRYKMLQVCRPLKSGTRVVVMKQSGTYIVLGEVSLPTSYYHPADLAAGATLANVIKRCNLILDILRNAGIIWPPEET